MAERLGKLLGSDVIYDTFAEKYRNYSISKGAYLDSIDRVLANRFKGKVDTMIDFGSGDGVRGSSLAKLLDVRTLIQADISDEMLKKCRELNQAAYYWDTKKPDWGDNDLQADLIVCLWNVLGHINGFDAQVKTLIKLAGLLKPNGSICLDVNNRHYVGYGRIQSLWRRFIDIINPKPSRGDVQFAWQIDGLEYQASGHFFTVAEMRQIARAAGLNVISITSVDYITGDLKSRPQEGQLFFEFRRTNL